MCWWIAFYFSWDYRIAIVRNQTQLPVDFISYDQLRSYYDPTTPN
jgi:hypothetical protein